MYYYYYNICFTIYLNRRNKNLILLKSVNIKIEQYMIVDSLVFNTKEALEILLLSFVW